MTISPGENISMGLAALWTHRFRSILTILGIVIGITTVVTVASLLTGLRAGVVTFFDELGPDNIFVFKTSGDPNEAFESVKERRRRPVKPEYADLIRRFSSAVQDVGVTLYVPPGVNGSIITAKVPGFETESLQIVGVSPNMIDLTPRGFDQGRYFTDEENRRAAHVAVLGFNIARALFPEGNAVRRTFMLDGAEYRVVGVLEKAKGGFFGENAEDTEIDLPLSTAETRYPQVDRFMVVSKAKPGLRKEAFDDIQAIIRRTRKVPTGIGNDFAISTPDQIIQQFDKITGLVGLVAIAISGLGLLVGGIGVMNIMLVSVTERTREIGVRKALGARRFDIIGQFLAEATALTSVGGLLGIAFAVLISLLLGVLVPKLPSHIPGWAVITGFTVSMAVGLFFGIWPAVKAARLDPVDALRYE
jgi:putative ABC transport system permease protein